MKKKGKKDREKRAVCPVVVVAEDEPEGYPEFECEGVELRAMQQHSKS